MQGVFAAYIQLLRGTKYSQFPSWLDTWLKMRKHLGILMLFSASIHSVFYMLMWTPDTEEMEIPLARDDHTWDWSKVVVVTGKQLDMDMRTSIYLGAGVMAYFLAVILGITSLPPVSTSLSWKEFRFLKSTFRGSKHHLSF